MNTKFLKSKDLEDAIIKEDILEIVKAFEDKGYNPIPQLSGYILTGEKNFITSNGGARQKCEEIGREALLENILRLYIEELKKQSE